VILSTIRTEVRERVGELSADFFTDAEVDRAINEALRRFSNEERWPWLFTEGTDTVAEDEDELELPENVSANRVFNVSVDSDSIIAPRTLERVSPDAGFRLRHSHHLHEGLPRWYYLTRVYEDGETHYVMKFIPAPDVDYSVEFQYVRVPDALSGASDEPDCPDEYQDAIPAWAAGKLFIKELQISQKASEQFALYADVLDKARKEMFNPNTDQIIARGREHPGERGVITEHDWVMGRIPPSLG
jgi:hypothetical protein